MRPPRGGATTAGSAADLGVDDERSLRRGRDAGFRRDPLERLDPVTSRKLRPTASSCRRHDHDADRRGTGGAGREATRLEQECEQEWLVAGQELATPVERDRPDYTSGGVTLRGGGGTSRGGRPKQPVDAGPERDERKRSPGGS